MEEEINGKQYSSVNDFQREIDDMIDDSFEADEEIPRPRSSEVRSSAYSPFDDDRHRLDVADDIIDPNLIERETESDGYRRAPRHAVRHCDQNVLGPPGEIESVLIESKDFDFINNANSPGFNLNEHLRRIDGMEGRSFESIAYDVYDPKITSQQDTPSHLANTEYKLPERKAELKYSFQIGEKKKMELNLDYFQSENNLLHQKNNSHMQESHPITQSPAVHKLRPKNKEEISASLKSKLVFKKERAPRAASKKSKKEVVAVTKVMPSAHLLNQKTNLIGFYAGKEEKPGVKLQKKNTLKQIKKKKSNKENNTKSNSRDKGRQNGELGGSVSNPKIRTESSNLKVKKKMRIRERISNQNDFPLLKDSTNSLLLKKNKKKDSLAPTGNLLGTKTLIHKLVARSQVKPNETVQSNLRSNLKLEISNTLEDPAKTFNEGMQKSPKYGNLGSNQKQMILDCFTVDETRTSKPSGIKKRDNKSFLKKKGNNSNPTGLVGSSSGAKFLTQGLNFLRQSNERLLKGKKGKQNIKPLKKEDQLVPKVPKLKQSKERDRSKAKIGAGDEQAYYSHRSKQGKTSKGNKREDSGIKEGLPMQRSQQGIGEVYTSLSQLNSPSKQFRYFPKNSSSMHEKQ